MKYLENYLKRISEKNPDIASSVKKTVDDIVPEYISNFTWKDHVVSLLAGDVQSGKTGQMFGIMSAAADEGFPIFILLTTDNITLQQQTYQRAKKDLADFCVCGESDYMKFMQNDLRSPSVIVLKKNGHVLKEWRNNLASSQLCQGNPLFIVDDEGDAASLNTKVNNRQQSTINKTLDEIEHTATSSIYLQVTGTPQAILLQTIKSGWKPYFIYYFHPGKRYLGGNTFFQDEPPKQIILTDNEESKEILNDDEFPENGLKKALVVHMLTSAQIMTSGGKVSNFLIHPSVKTDQHQKFAEKIGSYLNEISYSYEEDETVVAFRDAYTNLKGTKERLRPFDELYKYVVNAIQDDQIKILVLNSKEEFVGSENYNSGINILVGGNSLGRGVTFLQLQTIYYCRLAKNPQADTMWQHARMFGYDRDPDLMRIFMSPRLYKLFTDINITNNSIVSQIESNRKGEDVKIVYPTGLRPTRKNVLDKESVSIYTGGVNYFPFYPENTSIEAIDGLLEKFRDGDYLVNLRIILTLLEMVDSETDDWNSKAFQGFVRSIIVLNSFKQGRLIVRRNRDIGRGTGTLLAPNDRKLGDKFPEDVVLTMYKVIGAKGWNGKKIWIPNIKLPGDYTYYSGDDMTSPSYSYMAPIHSNSMVADDKASYGANPDEK